MKHTKLIYITLFVAFFSMIGSKIAVAKEDDDNLGYVVSAERHGKQIDTEKTFFYIQTAPGEEEELKVKVTSTKKEKVKIKVYATDAITGDSGTIEYTDDLKLLDASLTDPVTSMTKIETPSISVGNFETKEAIIKLTPPKESYSGVKMGALVFELESEKGKEIVGNKFAYRVGLITAETGDDFRDAKTLKLIDVKSTIDRGKKLVLATLQNPEPKILSGLQINAEITEKGKQEVVKRKKIESYSLAPNSHVDFAIDWGTTNIKAGTYIFKMDASNSFNDWKFEKEFTISKEQAKKMNEESVFKIITPTWIKSVTVALFFAMLSILTTLLVRRKKMEVEWKNRKKRKKRRKKKKKEGS